MSKKKYIITCISGILMVVVAFLWGLEAFCRGPYGFYTGFVGMRAQWIYCGLLGVGGIGLIRFHRWNDFDELVSLSILLSLTFLFDFSFAYLISQNKLTFRYLPSAGYWVKLGGVEMLTSLIFYYLYKKLWRIKKSQHEIPPT